MAAFIARRRDADSDAAASSSAAKIRVAMYRGSSASNSVVGVRLEREQRARPGVLLDVLRPPSARSAARSAICVSIDLNSVYTMCSSSTPRMPSAPGIVALVVGAGHERRRPASSAISWAFS